MKAVAPENREPQKPTEAKLQVLAERARRRLPLFTAQDSPQLFEENDHYLQFKRVNQAIALYLSLYRGLEHDEDAEVTFSQIAPIFGADPDRPRRYIHKLPMPCSEKKTKTATWVWRWQDVMPCVRHELGIFAIKTLAQRL